MSEQRPRILYFKEFIPTPVCILLSLFFAMVFQFNGGVFLPTSTQMSSALGCLREDVMMAGYVVLFISSFVLDQVVNSARQSVQFFIISKKHEEIGHRINKDLHRGVTFIDGVGCYTGAGVKMMFVLAKKRESTTIFRLIKDIDPNAFVSQSAVIGVFGEGFDRIKVK